MVANQDVHMNDENLANALGAVATRIEETTRHNAYPFSVAPGGSTALSITPDSNVKLANGQPVSNLTVGTGAGQTIISTRPGYSNNQTLTIYDLSGRPHFGTDELAGYGLSAPIYTYFMGLIPGYTFTSGVEREIARSEPFLYNPAWITRILIKNLVTMTSLSIRFVVTSGGVSVASSPATVTGDTFVTRIVLLPASFMNAQNVVGQWLVTPNATGTVEGYPVISAGRSKAAYDIDSTNH